MACFTPGDSVRRAGLTRSEDLAPRLRGALIQPASQERLDSVRPNHFQIASTSVLGTWVLDLEIFE